MKFHISENKKRLVSILQGHVPGMKNENKYFVFISIFMLMEENKFIF